MKPPFTVFTTTLCLLCGARPTAVAEPAPETWTPIGRMTQTITGRVTFRPSAITFQNGKSLTLAGGGQMLFRPEPKQKKVMAELYRVTPPDDLALENGNKLCKGRLVAYLILWKPEKVGDEADPRILAAFPGPKFTPGSPDDCGRYLYDAGH
jgi:hypothetical protein